MRRDYDYHRKRITHVQQRRSERWTIIGLLLAGGAVLALVFYLIAVR